MEAHEKLYRSRKRIIVDNFLGGISWSLGVTFGATIVFALIAFILTKINYVPIVGQFILNILKFVNDNSSTFIRR